MLVQKFCREALVWQALRHKYILPLIGIDRNSFSSYCLVSPWMKHGTILKYLREHRPHANPDKLILQIAEGLGYLHSKNIVHGDLRGANILVSDDESIRLADFGLSSICEADSTAGILRRSSDRAGSARWFAPELIIPTEFGCEQFARTTASDVYAFGCVCLELHTGKPPFSDVSEEMVVVLKVRDGERPARPSTMSDGLWAVVTAAWAQKFQYRPGIQTIITILSEEL
ncbi:kinase-like domain-containing protein [Mycena belliarum]|uniref:Kinase-like domain-containing protein n=1 Tax=Mycena belliarum TaxID=1033014 RepID=A0AAD6U3B0_9AGAR|nr:kinase-like domain-containing protein [Mycena belliae]